MEGSFFFGFNNSKDDLKLHFIASMGAALFCTIASLPADIVKTRLQQTNKNQYTGMVDCFTQLIKKEGVLSLWKGFSPYFFRLGPQTVLTFIFLEFLTKQTNKQFRKKS